MRYMRAIFVVFSLALAASTAIADVINGGFETGNLTGWTVLGNAYVTNLYKIPDPWTWTVTPYQGNYMGVVGTGDSFTSADVALLDAALGVTFPTGYYYGSAIYQDVYMKASDKLAFAWDFLGVDLIDPDKGQYTWNDASWLTVYGKGSGYNSIYLLSNVFTVGSRSSSGWNTFDVTVPYTDTYRIGFTTINWFDDEVESGLAVDAVQSPVGVPEPSLPILLGLGIFSVLAFGWRHRTAKLLG